MSWALMGEEISRMANPIGRINLNCFKNGFLCIIHPPFLNHNFSSNNNATSNPPCEPEGGFVTLQKYYLICSMPN
jgi:hypothetical protein